MADYMIPLCLQAAFQQLGKELDNYIKGARSMKTVVEGINRTVTSLCDKSLPRFGEFSLLLEVRNDIRGKY